MAASCGRTSDFKLVALIPLGQAMRGLQRNEVILLAL